MCAFHGIFSFSEYALLLVFTGKSNRLLVSDYVDFYRSTQSGSWTCENQIKSTTMGTFSYGAVKQPNGLFGTLYAPPPEKSPKWRPCHTPGPRPTREGRVSWPGRGVRETVAKLACMTQHTIEKRSMDPPARPAWMHLYNVCILHVY